MIPGGEAAKRDANDGRWCQRWWQSKKGSTYVCTLRWGHGGTYCIDTVHNVSHPTADTNQSAIDRALALLKARLR